VFRGGLIGSALCVLTALAACKTTELPSVTEEPAAYGSEEDEQRLIEQSQLLEDSLRRQGLLLRSPAVQEYVSAVGARLVPPDVPEELKFHFGVLREPTINAFSLANGGIYFHVGLLTRLENEAQLAHVLAHEIAHTIHRHQLEFLRHAENRITAAKVAQVLLMPPAAMYGASGLTGMMINLTLLASVNGFGREEEREADREALRMIAAGGYPVEQSPQLFELLQEVEDAGALESFFYASHPANVDRARYTRELVASGEIESLPGATDRRDAYLQATRGLLLENVRLRLSAAHYRYAAQEAQRALGRTDDDALLYYYIGEAHRRAAADPEGAAREEAFRTRRRPDDELVERFRNQVGEELAAAVEAYRRALELDPALAVAHRGLGLAAHEQGDSDVARRELTTYLELEPEARDRIYIEWILEGKERG
jgi:predicted Zn-dependent protease